MNYKVAVVIPYYHSELNELEKISLQQCLNILGTHEIILLVPESITAEQYYKDVRVHYKKVSDDWLKSVATYNRMMMSIDFYHEFKAYDYILIYQLDAFVFSDRLEEFCSYEYDYIGAPWLLGMKYYEDTELKVSYVGNGGLSLRKVSAFIKVLREKGSPTDNINEDLFFSSLGRNDLKVAPIDRALSFAFERNVRLCYEKNNSKLPFGCHAWEKYDFEFWKPIIEKYGYKLVEKLDTNLDFKESYIDCKYVYADEVVIKKSLRKLFENPDNDICIWGAGAYGKECGWLLKKNGIEILTYFDENEKLWEKTLFDIAIESPKVLENLKNKNIIIALKGYKSEALRLAEYYGYQHKKNVIYLFDLLNTINCEMKVI